MHTRAPLQVYRHDEYSRCYGRGCRSICWPSCYDCDPILMHKAAGLQGLPKLRGGHSRELHHGLQDAAVRTPSKHRQIVNSLWLWWGVAVTFTRCFFRYRLFKALGASYLMLWTGRNIQQFLRKVMEGVAAGDAEADEAADELPELHATCAGLKAFCTSWSANMIEASFVHLGSLTSAPPM